MNRPRDLAVRVLTLVLSEHRMLDEALGMAVDVPPEARAWLQEVCSGTLRWRGRIDAAVDSVALKKKPSGWLRRALMIAAYQLMVQERVHPGAVVSETVDQIRKKEGEAPARFANAALRKIAEHAASWRNQEFPQQGSVSEMAAWASLPEWLWKRLKNDHGLEWVKAYAMASLDRPRFWLRSRSDDWRPDGEVQQGPVPRSWLLEKTPEGSVSSWRGFAEGEFYVQDISSQTLVFEIGAELRRAGIKKVHDICAAPGGKSVGLAWEGFSVAASDRGEKRLPLLRDTLSRAAPEVEIEESWSPGGGHENVEAVWVDSPCSGSGILRKHPEVRWLRREEDVDALKKTQSELVHTAWNAIRPGGFLIYSVCSVLKDEGPRALERAGLSDKVMREWFLAPQKPPYGDGFWAALLRKPE